MIVWQASQNGLGKVFAKRGVKRVCKVILLKENGLVYYQPSMLGVEQFLTTIYVRELGN